MANMKLSKDGKKLLFKGFGAGDKVEEIKYVDSHGAGASLFTGTITIGAGGTHQFDHGLNLSNHLEFSWKGKDAAGTVIQGSLGPIVIQKVNVPTPPPPPVTNNVPNPLNTLLVAVAIVLGLLVLSMGVAWYLTASHAVPAAVVNNPNPGQQGTGGGTQQPPADPIVALTAEIDTDLANVAEKIVRREGLVAQQNATGGTKVNDKKAALKTAAGL